MKPFSSRWFFRLPPSRHGPAASGCLSQEAGSTVVSPGFFRKERGLGSRRESISASGVCCVSLVGLSPVRVRVVGGTKERSAE